MGGLLCLLVSGPAVAQQRPLKTQDPDPIGEGRILVEMGGMYLREQSFPVSGLRGHSTNAPSLGLRFGVGGVAELQVTHASYQHLTVTERSTHRATTC